jgi:hypothetical protein
VTERRFDDDGKKPPSQYSIFLHWHIRFIERTTMKLISTLALLAWAQSVSAFSAVAPKAAGSFVSSPDPVDKSMQGIDDAGSFDPTEGDNAALTRNNVGEVWVPQVSRMEVEIVSLAALRILDAFSNQAVFAYFTNSDHHHSGLDHAVTAKARRCVQWSEKTLLPLQTLFTLFSSTTKIFAKTLPRCPVVSAILLIRCSVKSARHSMPAFDRLFFFQRFQII